MNPGALNCIPDPKYCCPLIIGLPFHLEDKGLAGGLDELRDLRLRHVEHLIQQASFLNTNCVGEPCDEKLSKKLLIY